MRTKGKNFYRNHAKREAAKFRMLKNALADHEYGNFEGIVFSDERNARLSEIPEGYRGLALHINDHGNVSLLRCFKNGNTHYIAGMV